MALVHLIHLGLHDLVQELVAAFAVVRQVCDQRLALQLELPTELLDDGCAHGVNLSTECSNRLQDVVTEQPSVLQIYSRSGVQLYMFELSGLGP